MPTVLTMLTPFTLSRAVSALYGAAGARLDAQPWKWTTNSVHDYFLKTSHATFPHLDAESRRLLVDAACAHFDEDRSPQDDLPSADEPLLETTSAEGLARALRRVHVAVLMNPFGPELAGRLAATVLDRLDERLGAAADWPAGPQPEPPAATPFEACLEAALDAGPSQGYSLVDTTTAELCVRNYLAVADTGRPGVYADRADKPLDLEGARARVRSARRSLGATPD